MGRAQSGGLGAGEAVSYQQPYLSTRFEMTMRCTWFVPS
jgi:hypothetical protein